MAKAKRRLARDALQFIDPRWIPTRSAGVEPAFLDAGDCSSPVRVAVQVKTDVSPLADLVQKLIDGGFDADIAGSAVLELLLHPTIALAKSEPAGEKLLQAIVISRDPEKQGSHIEDSELRLCLRVQVIGGRPPIIEVVGFDFDLFDTEEERDGCVLVAEVATWLAEFPVPPLGGKGPGGQLILLGNPAKAHLTCVPADWSAKLIQVASAFGMSFRAVVSHSEASDFSPQAFIVSTDPNVARVAVGNGTPVAQLTPLTCKGQSFEDLVFEMIDRLIAHKSEDADVAPPTSRALADGECVYHRKVGNSRKFDRFDSGSSSPCTHGSSGFMRVHGPKSTKGMARRYTNFTPDMLFHCGKYPNCGVYAVFHKS